MKEAQVILNRLLDKFENSKHLSEPNVSRRRVMLRIDKGNCRSINTKMRWFGMHTMLRHGSWSSRLWCVWNGRESRAFSPASCWIWNGSHSAMNAPTECIRKKGRKRSNVLLRKSWRAILFHGSQHGGMLYALRHGTA